MEPSATTPYVQPQAPHKKRRSRKRYVLIGIFLLVVLGAAGGVYAMRSKLTSPVHGEVAQPVPDTIKQSQVERAQFDGTYFSFVHPMTYIEQTTKAPALAGQIESHTFISSGMNSELLVTVVANLPSGNLNDDASYSMRAQNSAKYKMRTAVVKNEKVTIFAANDEGQYQQAAFWAHNGKEVTFSLTGLAADVPAMTNEFNDIVNSIMWR